MAVSPDQAVPGWHEQIAEIVAAIEERESVVPQNINDVLIASLFGDGAPGRLRPVGARDLRRLTDRILHLSEFYLELNEVEGVRLGKLAKPAPFGRARLCEPGAEHSLAALPVAMAGRSCQAATDLYRDWMRAARWWLERFRYLDATPFCRFLKQVETETYPDAVDDSGDTETETEPEDGIPWGTAVSFDATEWTGRWDGPASAYSSIRYEDYDEADAEPFRAPDNIVSILHRKGIVVFNETGRDATLLMVPHATQTPWRTTFRRSFNGAPSWYAPDRIWRVPDGYDESFKREEWFGDSLRTVLEESNELREDGGHLKRTVHETDTYYTPNGSKSMNDAPDPYTRGSESIEPPIVNYLRESHAFDGFGLGFTAGVATTVATVPARRTIRRDEFLSGDLVDPAEWRTRSHDDATLTAPGACFRDSTVVVHATLGLAPVFDFGPSFHHLPPAQ